MSANHRFTFLSWYDRSLNLGCRPLFQSPIWLAFKFSLTKYKKQYITMRNEDTSDGFRINQYILVRCLISDDHDDFVGLGVRPTDVSYLGYRRAATRKR